MCVQVNLTRDLFSESNQSRGSKQQQTSRQLPLILLLGKSFEYSSNASLCTPFQQRHQQARKKNTTLITWSSAQCFVFFKSFKRRFCQFLFIWETTGNNSEVENQCSFITTIIKKKRAFKTCRVCSAAPPPASMLTQNANGRTNKHTRPPDCCWTRPPEGTRADSWSTCAKQAC